MSTKCSLKWKEQTTDSPGYHIYEDALDDASDGEQPVFLRLDGVELCMKTLAGGIVSVTVSLPRAIARELGLLKND